MHPSVRRGTDVLLLPRIWVSAALITGAAKVWWNLVGSIVQQPEGLRDQILFKICIYGIPLS